MYGGATFQALTEDGCLRVQSCCADHPSSSHVGVKPSQFGRDIDEHAVDDLEHHPRMPTTYVEKYRTTKPTVTYARFSWRP